MRHQIMDFVKKNQGLVLKYEKHNITLSGREIKKMLHLRRLRRKKLEWRGYKPQKKDKIIGEMKNML